jgi:cell division septation protein DedD
MKQCLILLALLCAVGDTLVAQKAEPDIKRYVAAINNGNADDVRREIPVLVTKYPNNPGVMYLQGLVTREGSEAIRTYQSIVDNFPESEWADDALYRIYQFYYALGLYRTAEIKMKQLVEKFPDSPYAKNAAGAGTAEPAAAEPQPATEKAAPAEKEAPAGHIPVIPPPIVQPSTEAVPAQADTVLPVRFVLQVGAFGLQNNAQSLKERFEASGYSVEMISKVKDTRALFLVWVGNYATYEEARAAGQDVKRKMGVDAIVISR